MTPRDEIPDLVRHYGNTCDVAGALRAQDRAELWGQARQQALQQFNRIAEALAQQPVQARSPLDLPWWIHSCGRADTGIDGVIPEPGCNYCHTSGPWRPLLVATDPAPARAECDHGRLIVRLLDITGVDKAVHLPAAVQNLMGAQAARDDARAELHHHLDSVDRLAGELNEARVELARYTDEDGSPLPTDAELDIRITEVTREREYWKRRFEEQATRGDEDGQRILTLHAEVERLQAAQRVVEMADRLDATRKAIGPIFLKMATAPDPLVLTLPKVPERAYDGALLGSDGDRYVWTSGGVWEAVAPRPGWRGCLGHLLEREGGSVRVEMAPPREPRTWPKLDEEHADLPSTVVVERHGIWRRLALPDDRLYEQADAFGAIRVGLRLPLSGLQLLGGVFEVFDDEPETG